MGSLISFELSGAWKWLLPTVVSLGLGIALIFCHIHGNTMEANWHNEQAVHQRDLALVKAGTEKAKADAVQHALTVERKNDEIKDQKAKELTAALAAARADANAYVLRKQASGGSRGVGSTSLPKTTNASTGASGTSPSSELDDTQVCAENTVKAEGWLDWFLAVGDKNDSSSTKNRPENPSVNKAP